MNAVLPTEADQRYLDTRQAFDSVAGEYRGPLGNNRPVQAMRAVLWRTVLETTAPGGRLLDLGCGAGLDAVYFAGQGYQVEAIDWSPEMVAQTRRTAEEQGVTDRVTAVNVGIHELSQLSRISRQRIERADADCVRGASFQPAVSLTSSQQGVRNNPEARKLETCDTADWKSAPRTEDLAGVEKCVPPGTSFDCIYSDLGALNCVGDLDTVARDCQRLLKPGGKLVFSVIGRHCPWELAYYGLHWNWPRATLRWKSGPVPVGLNGHTVWTRYYSPREFYHFFTSRFTWQSCRGLNLFLPPPYLGGPFEKRPAWLKPLAWLDDHLAGLPLFNRAGDHFLLVLTPR